MSEQRKPSIFIAVPAYRGWTRNECARSLMQLAYTLATAGVSTGGKMPDRENISAIRNFFGSLMLEQPQWTHLLFVDNDMEFQAEAVLKLIRANRPLIGAVCALRRSPPMTNVWMNPSPDTLSAPLDKVPGIGMALTLIETQVFRALLATGKLKQQNAHNFAGEGLAGPLVGFFDRQLRESDGMEIPEDFSFCLRWRELCGGDVWALVGEDISHVGDMVYRLPAR